MRYKEGNMAFDYDNAERDILDAGGDPDYLRYNDPAKRDKYLQSLGMKPESYGGGSKDPHYKKGSKTFSSEGCFLTSACTEAHGLPDDCYELTTLRKYRDSILAKQTGGSDGGKRI